MDPISIGLALASLASATYGRTAANKTAQQGLAFQQQNLANALSAARDTQFQRMQQAGGIRQDQFGNSTYYDPNQGRWITLYTPEQQRLLDADQARQERTLTRGAQASEDYAQQRAGYLYNQPPTEALIRQQIMQLIQQGQGQGERALNTIMDRFGTRTAGNIPVITQMDKGPDPGQQLAETMLKARAAALSESGIRQKQHGEQYLPALAAFERTANTVPQEGPFGKDISALTSAGQQGMLGALGDYGKQLAAIYGRGGQDTATAYGQATTAAGNTPKISEFASLINALKSGQGKTTGKTGVEPIMSGTTGSNTGGGGSSISDPYAGTAFSYGVGGNPGGNMPTGFGQDTTLNQSFGLTGSEYDYPINPESSLWAF